MLPLPRSKEIRVSAGAASLLVGGDVVQSAERREIQPVSAGRRHRGSTRVGEIRKIFGFSNSSLHVSNPRVGATRRMAGRPTRAWSACHVYASIAVPSASTGWTLLLKRTTSYPMRCRAEQLRISDQLAPPFLAVSAHCAGSPSSDGGSQPNPNCHLWPHASPTVGWTRLQVTARGLLANNPRSLGRPSAFYACSTPRCRASP